MQVDIFNPKKEKIESLEVFVIDNAYKKFEVLPIAESYGLISDCRLYKYNKAIWLHEGNALTKRRLSNFVIGKILSYREKDISQALYTFDALYGENKHDISVYNKRCLRNVSIITFDDIDALTRLKYAKIGIVPCYTYLANYQNKRVERIITTKHNRVDAVGLKEVLE